MYFLIYFIVGYLVAASSLFFLKPNLRNDDDIAWSLFISFIITSFWPMFLISGLIYLPYYLVNKNKNERR